MTFTGLTQARARLERLAQGLREIAGGAALARAASKVAAQVDAVAKAKAGAHIESGAAASTVLVTTSGELVQLSNIGYLRFHAWWPFRRGMPPFVVKNASVILAREVVAAIGGNGGGALGTEAGAVVEEANAAETSKAVEKVKRVFARRAKAAERKRETAKRREAQKAQRKAEKARG